MVFGEKKFILIKFVFKKREKREKLYKSKILLRPN
jgi:hypothetical protein